MTKINSLNRKSKLAKYRIIGEKLIDDILSGTYLVDSLLPTENTLCKQFNISRHTAREALRYVEKTGLVERRQGSGTQVKRNTMPEEINQFINSVNDLMHFGERTRFNIDESKLITVDETLTKLLDTEPGRECIYVAGVRTEPHDQLPICYSQLYRLPHMDDVDEALKNKQTAIYAVVAALNQKSIGKIEQKISACLVPDELASVLNSAKGSAAMKITRRYFDKTHNDLILVAQSIYPAKRFSFSSVLYANE